MPRGPTISSAHDISTSHDISGANGISFALGKTHGDTCSIARADSRPINGPDNSFTNNRPDDKLTNSKSRAKCGADNYHGPDSQFRAGVYV